MLNERQKRDLEESGRLVIENFRKADEAFQARQADTIPAANAGKDAGREDGQILITESGTTQGAADLSALPPGQINLQHLARGSQRAARR